MPGEGGVRVCGDAVLLDFWCGFCGNFYVKLRYCGFTKSSGLLYLEILGGISMRFAHVILCGVYNAVQFCGIRTPLMSPSQDRGAFDDWLGGVRYLN